MTSDKQHADWLAWGMQYVLGLVVGGMGGLSLSEDTRFGGTLRASAFAPLFMLGCALLAAGASSRYGDRLWLYYRPGKIPSGGINQSQLSLALSLISAAGGVILAAFAVGRTQAWF